MVNKFEELVNTLKNSGIAASNNDAIRMAKEMMDTEVKVRDDFQRRSEFITNNSMKKEKIGISNDMNECRIDMSGQIKKEMVERANNKESIVIRSEYEVPKKASENETTLRDVMEEKSEAVFKEKEDKEDISVKEMSDADSAEANVNLSNMFDFTKRPSD